MNRTAGYVILMLLWQVSGFTQNYETLSEGKVKNISVINGSFLGGEKRNFYGTDTPERLDVLWKFYLGKGKTVISKKIGEKEWAGSGWTGQPLLVKEDEKLFLVQGAFDHHLRKIDAATGTSVWKYKFDDVIKGTGTLWINPAAKNIEQAVVILQGSRLGIEKDLYSKFVPSFRAVSYFTGNELWRMNSSQTASYSRDVDGSALIYKNTAFIGLENALFTVFNPDPQFASITDGMLQPKISHQVKLYDRKDQIRHGGNLVVESSPARIGDKIYITAGSGHVYGYDITRKELVWDYYIGSDIDGSPVVTDDNCLLVTVEKQYIDGQGGVFKLDPSKDPSESVVWYFPVQDDSLESWAGGVIGSVSVNDSTRKDSDPSLCAFIGIDGFLYVVDHKQIDTKAEKVFGPNKIHTFATPKLIFKKQIGPSISTPLLVDNKIIATAYTGIYLFSFDKNLNFTLQDKWVGSAFESTGFVWDKKIFIGARNGYLYCFGDKHKQ